MGSTVAGTALADRAFWNASPVDPADPAVRAFAAALGPAIELREALVELRRMGPSALAPRLDRAHADLLVAGELGQRDTWRGHVLIRADFAIAPGRSTLVRR